MPRLEDSKLCDWFEEAGRVWVDDQLVPKRLGLGIPRLGVMDQPNMCFPHYAEAKPLSREGRFAILIGTHRRLR
jgi:hypothetical protein